MAFTFQVNPDISFHHEEALLAKAEEYTPKLLLTERQPISLVTLVKDEHAYMGYTMKPGKVPLAQLSQYALARNDSLIFDLGSHAVGHFQIHLASTGSPMDAPLYLRLRFAEIPAELAADSSQYDGWLSRSWIQEEFIHLDALPVTLKMPRRYSCRYIELTVIDTSPKWQLTVSQPLFIAESSADRQKLLPRLKYPGILEQIAQTSINTLAECMQEVLEDGPKRDRRLWLGDLRLQALANYCTFDRTDIIKRCLYLFGGMTSTDGKIPANVFVKPQAIPDDTFLFDYGLFFISVLHDYLAHHFEQDVLDDLFPAAQREIDFALQYVDNVGCFHPSADNPVFVDWSDTFDKTTAGQAILIYTLKQFLTLAKQKGLTLAPYQEALQRMTRFAKEQLWDNEHQLFISGEKHEINLASQVWMALAEVLPPDENHTLMNRSLHKFSPIQGFATPYMYHHITEALFLVGLNDEALQLMESYWGKMLQLGADTFWEAFDPNQPTYSPYGNPIISSFCHAWSCTPIYLLHQYYAPALS